VRVETLQMQLSTALHRLTVLQRRAEHLTPDTPKLLQRTLKELEGALEQLRAAQDQLVTQRDELSAAQALLEIERRKYWQLFDAVSDACVVTTPEGEILEANRAAAALLNISQRFLTGRSLAVFICTDRARVLAQVSRLAEYGGSAEWIFSIRPRERAPFDAACRVVASDEGDRTLRWVMKAVSDKPATQPEPRE
jgi:PAS domain-containing protein